MAARSATQGVRSRVSSGIDQGAMHSEPVRAHAPQAQNTDQRPDGSEELLAFTKQASLEGAVSRFASHSQAVREDWRPTMSCQR